MSPLARVGGTGLWAGSHLSIDNLTGGWMTYQGQPTTSSAWGTQYRAIYVPVRVPARCTIKEMGWVSSSTAAGYCNVGLYYPNGTRIVSTDTTLNNSTSVTRAVDVTDTAIGPGLYYIGLNNDTTTDTFASLSAAAPLPAAFGILTETVGAVEVQTLTISDQDAEDTFTLFYPNDSYKTPAIEVGNNCTAANIQTQLRALAGIPSGLTVSGTTDVGPFTITFVGRHQNETQIGVSDEVGMSAGINTTTEGAPMLPATASWAVNQTLNFIPLVTALLVTEVS